MGFNQLFAVLLVGLVGLLGCNAPVNSNEGLSQPNILFIVVDDLNDWVGHLGGHSQTITPNLDQLAASGMVFNNAHTNAPLCGPSRASMLTGLRPSTSGVYFHISDHDLVRQIEMDSIRAVLLPDYLEQNGYKTMGVGKVFHLGDGGGVFDEYGGLADFGPRPEKHFKYDPTWLDKPKGTSTDWGAFPEHDSLTFDQRIADWSIEKLGEKHDKPFFLATGFMRPHVPWYVPQKWFDQFGLDTIQTPPYFQGDWDDIPEMAGKITDWPMMPEMEWMLEEGYWKEAVQAYLASVHFVDYQIGRLLEALEASDYADNTIIVLVSDHGYHMGEKGLFQKGTLWQRSTHIPMIWSGPGIAKGTTNEPASLLDIYPTLLDFCGLEQADQLEGASLVPILGGESETINNVAITTYGPNNHSVIDGKWHYIRYNDGAEELYNLVDDPNEWSNLIGQVGAISDEELEHHLPKNNQPNNPDSHVQSTPYYAEYSTAN
ncbi:sulfatase [Marinoscillum sp. MHG1-6]|uniref:sulfatase n=1 Tax=Marinoscillum sp. MHG1-6 TaxID=2959627 RepID=UPI0021587185|nr:sulfatase [Marinoscillum sp. MHG1-6]